ncbi:hypothetical protein QTO34_014180 [Cnephaeus nilssonii]|uniref:Uncharacterized protein n=1 Tax=Cnephaeus nilssonii TaxID=3371016 RepID=A0AA40LCU4_CNENI|nr:hypothetical protein QTO34_014180 [Eptesicus nilssonii]
MAVKLDGDQTWLHHSQLLHQETAWILATSGLTREIPSLGSTQARRRLDTCRRGTGLQTATTQETGKSSRTTVYMGGQSTPWEMGPGKSQSQVQVTGESEGLTQQGQKFKVLQHHIQVQLSLTLIKEAPFLPGEVQDNVLKGHANLSEWRQLKPELSL